MPSWHADANGVYACLAFIETRSVFPRSIPPLTRENLLGNLTQKGEREGVACRSRGRQFVAVFERSFLYDLSPRILNHEPGF